MDNNNFKILKGKEISYKDIQEAIDIDNIVYPAEFRGTMEVCKKWFNQNPDIYTFVKDTISNKIIGYANLMPLNDEYYKLVECGNLMDIDIPAEAIRKYNTPGNYKICLTSIAINKNFQNSKVIKFLYSSVIDLFIELSKKKIYCAELIADAISDDGNKFCSFIGMNKVNTTSHGTSIYEVKFLPPEFSIINDKCKILYDIYSKVN